MTSPSQVDLNYGYDQSQPPPQQQWGPGGGPPQQQWGPGGGPPQVVYTQPTHGGHPPVTTSNTSVVINQPAQARQLRSWSQGMCGCFDDCGICVCVAFCSPCAAFQLAQDLGEFACLACCVPNWLTAVRTKVRMQLGIQGSICDDCCMVSFCGWCTMCQVMREVKLAKGRGEMM